MSTDPRPADAGATQPLSDREIARLIEKFERAFELGHNARVGAIAALRELQQRRQAQAGAVTPPREAVIERLRLIGRLGIEGTTHWDGCWQDGHRSHDACAVEHAARLLSQPSAGEAPYWSPEWVEGALTEHVRALGCKCKTPLIGYVPKVGPRCRLCGVEPSAGEETGRLREARSYFDAGIAAAETAIAKVSAAGRPHSFALGLAAAGEAVHALFDDDDEAWDAANAQPSGEPDRPTQQEPEEECGDVWLVHGIGPRYVCNRPKGHEGRHAFEVPSRQAQACWGFGGAIPTTAEAEGPTAP
jgi:hypothetical protein